MDSLIGTSEAMMRLRRFLPKAARSEASVLITGETGTGKEIVAELIHRMSARNHAPFFRINCAAIPDSLVESELFGYERGAFTGAHASYPGKLRLANGGTVFLDEIGEMSRFGQAKLLRVLESREVFPLGGKRTIPVDIRVVAATNQRLEPLMEMNEFRHDLYYRLNVARLQLPPLRERKEDILPLFEFFLAEFNARKRLTVQGPSPTLRDCLSRYNWPGNVRELRNMVEIIFIDPPSGLIEIEDLPDPFHQLFAGFVSEPSSERERLLSILETTNWNKSRAAIKLNWSRMTLYRKLSKYEMISPRCRTVTCNNCEGDDVNGQSCC
jgi:two-component system response regulator HydG